MTSQLTNPTPTTVADKAAALTYLNINYKWPKTIDFKGEDGWSSTYRLSFVMKNSAGTICMNVLKPTGEYTNEHCGTSFLDAGKMVDMDDAGRSSLIITAAETALKEHIAHKKAFLKSQIEAVQQGQTVKPLNTFISKPSSEIVPYISKKLLELAKKNTSMESWKQKFQNQPHGEDYDQDYPEEQNDTAPFSFNKPKGVIPDSVKSAMTKPVQSSDDGFTDTSNDEQKFIQRVGVMSNLNVSIQGKRTGFTTIHRLFCDKCKASQIIASAVITKRVHTDEGLVEFCNTHRHVAIVSQGDSEESAGNGSSESFVTGVLSLMLTEWLLLW